MVCMECAFGFFYDPLKIGIVLISFILAISALIGVKRSTTTNGKLTLIYAHLFALVFPFVFYGLYNGCQQFLSACQDTRQVLLLFALTGIVSLLLGIILAPILYVRKYKKKTVQAEHTPIHSNIAKLAKKLHLQKPRITIIDSAKPIAFSVTYLKASVFISIGLIELLTKKELEAVLLHEMGHIQQRSSILKFSIQLLQLVSPLARFTSFAAEMNQEERDADQCAIQYQGTERYVHSARRKVEEFYRQEDAIKSHS